MTDNITLPRATVQQALLALEDWWGSFPDFRSLHDKVAIAALRTALEQQAEPTMWGSGDGYWILAEDKPMRPDKELFNIPFYTAPPQQQAEPVADTLGQVGFQEWWDAVADDYEVNDFKKMRRAWNAAVKYEAQPQRKPLNEKQVHKIWRSLAEGEGLDEFARAIEAAHGIKEGT